jgi:hypothetical protein
MPLVSVKLSDDSIARLILFRHRLVLTPAPCATQASLVYLAAILSETFSTLHKVAHFMEADTFLTGWKNEIYNLLMYNSRSSTT